MATKLNELPVEVRRALVEAAVDLTRLRTVARKAVLLVLVEGYRQIDAAKKLKCKKQHVNTALRIVRPKLAEVEDYFASLSEQENDTGGSR